MTLCGPPPVVGIPVQEDYYMAQATEKIFLAPIRLALQPDMEEMYMPAPGWRTTSPSWDCMSVIRGMCDRPSLRCGERGR